MSPLIAVLSGLLFGTGLLAAGMADPAKVKGFLDLFGLWWIPASLWSWAAPSQWG